MRTILHMKPKKPYNIYFILSPSQKKVNIHVEANDFLDIFGDQILSYEGHTMHSWIRLD